MKKSLIALAAMASVGAVHAQSSVTVYGVLDAGYSDVSRDVTTSAGVSEKQTQKAFSFNNYSSSRLGVRGSEDLGGGTRANFVIETGIGSNVMAGYSQSALNLNAIGRADRGNGAANNGTTIDATSLGSRELNASLVFKSGTTLGAGFGSTGVRNTWAAFDPAGGTNLVGNLLTQDPLISSNRATGVGIAQKFGDFTVGAAIAQNNANTLSSTSTSTLGETKTGTGYTLNLGYGSGPFAFAAARQETKSKTNAGSATVTLNTAAAQTESACTTGNAGIWTALGQSTGTGGAALSTCSTGALIATDVKRTIDIIGASYDLGVAKLFGQYGKVKIDDAATVNALGEGERKVYVLGATVPVNQLTLFGLVSNGSQTMVTTGAATAGHATSASQNPVKRDLTGYTVGARYALSKRTFGYAAIGQSKLDASSEGGSYNYGVKVQQTSLGLVHSF